MIGVKWDGNATGAIVVMTVVIIDAIAMVSDALLSSRTSLSKKLSSKKTLSKRLFLPSFGRVTSVANESVTAYATIELKLNH